MKTTTQPTCSKCCCYADETRNGYCRQCKPSLWDGDAVTTIKPLLACSICSANVAVTSAGLCATCYEPKPAQPQRRPRPSWDDYFFDMACLVSKRATCPRASIGVVIVDDKHRVLATGFNGALAGEPHCTDVGCTIFADHCVRATHAEVSALESAWAFKEPGLSYPHSVGDSADFLEEFSPTAYVVGPRPICSHCARELHAAGIKEVKWRES